MEAVVREYGARASPEGNIQIEENASRALNGELGCYDCEHARSAAETISEGQDVRVTSRRDSKRAGVVDSDGNAESVWQGNRDDGPPDRQSQGFPRLALQAVLSHYRVQMLISIHQ